jgi:cobalt-zinc-cadmium efflux system protein
MAHTHNHNHGIENITADEITRSFMFGIVLNAVYVVVELWYGLRVHSTALLSDAVHNISDISGLLLAFAAFRLQQIKPSRIFTYGFKKGSILVSFINSLLLAFAIGAIAWEGVKHIIEPSPINGTTVIIVATMGIVINFASALMFRKREKEDLNIKAAYWHLMADALVSLGVVVAGLIMRYTGWYFLDGFAALVVAGVILYSTWNLFKDSLISVFDGVPSSIDIEEIKEHLLAVNGVLDVHHIHIWSMSTNENAITCHIVLDSFENLATAKQQLKEELCEHNITHITLEFEMETEFCEDRVLVFE